MASTGKMEWEHLGKKAMADDVFKTTTQAKGIADAELPQIFDILKATPVMAEPRTPDAAIAQKCKDVRAILDSMYGANPLYTGMGATLNPDGSIGAREVMVSHNGSKFGLNAQNHKLVSLGVITPAMVDAIK